MTKTKKAVRTPPDKAPTREDYLVNEHGLEWPRAKRIKDMPVLEDSGWACVCGTALVDDLFNWRSILTEREAFTEQEETIQSLIEEIFDYLWVGTKPQTPIGLSRHHIALSVMNGLSHLVAFSLTQPGARKIIKAQLARDIQFQKQQAKEWWEYDKQTALDLHRKEEKLPLP